MDTSHIYRIGKHLDTLQEPPCCRSTGDEHFSIMPTSLSFNQVVDDLPFLPRSDLGKLEYISHDRNFDPLKVRLFNFINSNSYSPRQNRAFDAFRVIHGEVLRNFKARGVNIREIRQYAVCFDELLFEGKLLERCAIEYSDEMEGITIGETRLTHYCPEHQQCHAVCINLLRPPFIRDVSPKALLEKLLGLLLHELCHAWVRIFFEFRGITVENALCDYGATFHGRAWSCVMMVGVVAAYHLFRLNIDEDRHWVDPGEKDSAVKDDLESLMTRIESSTLESPGCIQRLVEWHHSIDADRASHFLPLLAKGFTVLQALTLVRGLQMDLWLSPEMRDLVPKDWNYVEYESLSDWENLKAAFRRNGEENTSRV